MEANEPLALKPLLFLLGHVLALSIVFGLECGQVVGNAFLSIILYYVYVAKGKAKDTSIENEKEGL